MFYVDSKTRLIVAMSDLMWERGYAAASPREVQARAGVGQGSMYHHFPSKRDLALAALEHNCTDLLPAVEELEGPGDPMERIESYLTRTRDALKGCKVGRMTQDPEVVADPGLLAPVTLLFSRMHRAWTSAIREAIAAGELRSGLEAESLAHLMMATLQGGYVLAIAQQDAGPFTAAHTAALDLLRAAAPVTAKDVATEQTAGASAPTPFTQNG